MGYEGKGKVDRIACPWLISRFIDKEPEFIFVPKEEVMDVAKKEGAIPFDTPGAELHHFIENGYEYVSFDAIIRKYGLKDPALLEMAKIVRSADSSPPVPFQKAQVWRQQHLVLGLLRRTITRI